MITTCPICRLLITSTTPPMNPALIQAMSIETQQTIRAVELQHHTAALDFHFASAHPMLFQQIMRMTMTFRMAAVFKIVEANDLTPTAQTEEMISAVIQLLSEPWEITKPLPGPNVDPEKMATIKPKSTASTEQATASTH